MLRQGRDSTRMREIGTLHRAISMLRIDTPAAPLGSPNTIHVSIPSDSPTCANLGLPIPPSGWSYRCVSAANLRNIDNTGWIPIDFTVMPRGSPLASLPVDPVNTVASSNFYVFVTDGRTWTLASLMESERHAPSAARDGGTDFARFEAGTNLSLWTSASGLVGYWSFDEGAGTTARDLSGRGNTGTLVNNPTWVEGRVGRALSFDGVDDFVEIGNRPILNFHGTQPFTIEAWVRPAVANHGGSILNRYNGGIVGNYKFRLSAARLFISRQTSPYISLIGDTTLIANTWHHVVGTYNGNHMSLFVNGSSNAIPITSGSVSDSVIRVLIGASLHMNNPVHFFNGLIDEVRIHNRALTEAEIRTIFNATR